VINALEAAQVDYLLGGSLALAAWGEPRSTLDVDLVVNLSVEQMQPLSDALTRRGILAPVDLMLDLGLENRGDVALTAYHTVAGFKAEFFMLRPGDALRESALARRRPVDLGPPLGYVHLHSPEDLILYKLKYFDIGEQTKHVRDILGILLARGPELDWDYLDRWVGQLRLAKVWQYIVSEARRLGAALP
jgi:hypothetical protein